jgi:hypothetical protein
MRERSPRRGDGGMTAESESGAERRAENGREEREKAFGRWRGAGGKKTSARAVGPLAPGDAGLV